MGIEVQSEALKVKIKVAIQMLTCRLPGIVQCGIKLGVGWGVEVGFRWRVQQYVFELISALWQHYMSFSRGLPI